MGNQYVEKKIPFYRLILIENLPLMHLRNKHLFHCIVHFHHNYRTSPLPLIEHIVDPINLKPLFSPTTKKKNKTNK